MSRSLFLFLLAGLAFLAAACRLDVAVDLTVDRDGGGRMAVAVAADAELLTRAAAAGADPLGRLAATGAALAADGWDLDDETTPDGTRRVTLSTAFADADELSALSADLAGALDAPEVRLLAPFEVAVSDQRVRVDGHASLVPTAATVDLGLLPEDAVRLLRESDAVGYTVTVTMPGDVLTTAGTQVERAVDTVQWSLAPGEEAELDAVSARPPPPLWPRLVGGLSGGLLTAAAVLLFRRRRAARA